ncbi:MAG: DUF5103 domain-containing protein [Prevotella sp.]|nr:DUF5103 domain-containing protein [Prevotella sp.]
MRHYSLIITLALVLLLNGVQMSRAQVVYASDISTLTTMVNNRWLALPVMKLNSADQLEIGFDQLSHEYHRYKYHIQHCEADFTPSEEIFESDFLEGFNDNYIDDYLESINTNQLYTHYSISIPNDRCRLKMSGNYLLTVIDENNDDERVLEVPFYVVEPVMTIRMEVFTNTDATINKQHQQVNMWLNYGDIRVTNQERQIFTVVKQNGLCQNATSRQGVKPNIVKDKGLEWTHNKELIFEAGNEYKKFEILDTDHPSMGVDKITWDGQHFHAWVFTDELQSNYLTDEDANGAFLIRNSDYAEIDNTCEYMLVHFTLKAPASISAPEIDGAWTTDADKARYKMEWDEQLKLWHACIPLKMGYYSYRYLIPDVKENFFQTENTYQCLVYYKVIGERTWRLVGFNEAAYPSRRTASPY